MFYWGTAPQQGNPDIAGNPPSVENVAFQNSPQQDVQQYTSATSINPAAMKYFPENTEGLKEPQFSQGRSSSFFSGPMLWIMLIIACVVLIAVLLVLDKFII